MAAEKFVSVLPKLKHLHRQGLVPCRFSNTLPNKLVEKHRTSQLSHTKEEEQYQPQTSAPRDYKYVLPDFMPDPAWWKRDRISELLARRDMIRRRSVIDIPEFYVGSIMAVTVSDPYAPGKKNRFVGICIQRGGHLFQSHFTLRNIVEGQGVEIRYEIYSPQIQKIDVLRLEKRLDDQLFYLRDAPVEYSTVPFDFEPVPHPPGVAVPINTMKVKMGPRPWHERWERADLQGVEDLGLPERFYERARKVAKPWEKHDLMKQYREQINEPETEQIMAEVHENITELARKKALKKMSLPVKFEK